MTRVLKCERGRLKSQCWNDVMGETLQPLPPLKMKRMGAKRKQASLPTEKAREQILPERKTAL